MEWTYWDSLGTEMSAAASDPAMGSGVPVPASAASAASGGGGYNALNPVPPQVTTQDRPRMQSRTDLTNPEEELYNNMVRAKNRQPPPVDGQVSGGGGGSGSGSGALPKRMSTVKAADISDPANTSDYWYILLAVLFIDVLVIFLVRFYPDIFGRNLNRWYDLFGLNAVIADVLIIVLGFVVARYVYTKWVAPTFTDGEWSPLAFTGTLVGVQAIHDILFYLCVISPIPRGHNLMMDVFKDYATSGGAKIIGGDALMVIGSSALAIVLKGMRPDLTAVFGLLTAYALPYILYTRNQFTVLR